MNSPERAWRQPLQRTLTLAWLESLAIRRDPVILAMVLLIPALQIALFGYAIRPLGGEVPVAIARAQADPATVKQLQAAGSFRVVADGLSEAAALAKVKSQEALIAVVVVPPPKEGSKDPAADAADEGGQVTVFVDDSDPVRINPALSKLESLYWRQVAESGALAPPETRVVRLYNPQSRPEWIMTPGLSGAVVMISMLMLGALAVVRERERGTWEALRATPVGAAEAVVGKAMPYLLLGFAQAALVIGSGVWLFGLPLRGDLWAFAGFLGVYVGAHLLIGLAISAAASSQLQAVQGAVLVYLPSMLLSGFLFPFADMPAWARRIGAVLPLTYYVEAARGVMLRGADAAFVHARTLPVAGIAAAALLGAVLAFRRR